VADSSSSQDRSERPTAKRLREARERGQVPRSRELSTALVVGAGVALLIGTGRDFGLASLRLMGQGLQLDAELLSRPQDLAALLLLRLGQGLLAAAPLLGATLLGALLAPWLLGGWNMSFGAIRPDFSRINPLSGLGRIVSSHGLVELGKGLAKIGTIGAVAAVYLWRERATFAALAMEPLKAAIGHSGALCLGLAAWLAGALLLIGLIDAPYQRWTHLKRLRMTRQEVREEMKQSEGRPEVKARIRRLQHEMSRRRMMEQVPKADVVVTNPTHYAVALQYSAERMRAPRVVAKGAGVVAAAIRELATRHHVPLVSAPPLARALYRNVDLDREIPAELYAAVAQVLTYIYQLREGRGATPPPRPPQIGDVPGGEPDE
jgi:flagellar biosynthetic protein FlhB